MGHLGVTICLRGPKLNIYRSIVESIATYDAELCIINKQDASRIRNNGIRMRIGLDVDVRETIMQNTGGTTTHMMGDERA